MKGGEIKLGDEYAVRFITTAVVGRPGKTGSCPRSETVRRCRVVDKRTGRRVVVSYPGFKCIGGDLRTGLRWRAQDVLVEVATSDFIAPYGDWTPPGVRDGRIDPDGAQGSVHDALVPA